MGGSNSARRKSNGYHARLQGQAGLSMPEVDPGPGPPAWRHIAWRRRHSAQRRQLRSLRRPTGRRSSLAATSVQAAVQIAGSSCDLLALQDLEIQPVDRGAGQPRSMSFETSRRDRPCEVIPHFSAAVAPSVARCQLAARTACGKRRVAGLQIARRDVEKAGSCSSTRRRVCTYSSGGMQDRAGTPQQEATRLSTGSSDRRPGLQSISHAQ